MIIRKQHLIFEILHTFFYFPNLNSKFCGGIHVVHSFDVKM